MKADLVKIGNSRGVRIPKPIIERWEEAFRNSGGVDKDELLLPGPNDFDSYEREW